MKPLKYVNFHSIQKSSDKIWSVLRKVLETSVTVYLLLPSMITPCDAQSRPGDPGFFEEGDDVLDREIERLHQPPQSDDDLLIIDNGTSDWMQVTSNQGRFVVMMPGTPTQQPEPEILTTDAANLSAIKITLQTDDVWFLVAYADYPIQIELDAPQVLLSQIRSSLAAQLGNPSTEEREIIPDDYRSREIRFQTPNEISTFRLYLVDRRLYILGAQQSSLNPISDQVNRFFDSFQVLGADP